MKVLFITPSFFGYESDIAAAIRREGHSVDVFDERPSNSPLAKAILRVFPALMRRRSRAHFRILDAQVAVSRYDLLLVVKGEVTPRHLVEEFARRNPNAPRVLYLYDSITNSPQAEKLISAFTHTFSFDRDDVTRFPELRYKPLFYGPEYFPSREPRALDVSFVGTLHGDRYAVTQSVLGAVPTNKAMVFYFVPARWYFWIRKLVSADVRPVSPSAVSTDPLDAPTVARIARSSRAVIDVEREGQSGLTMRTFEVLATGAGLITTNDAIRYESFYDPARILVVPRSPSEIDATQVAEFIRQQPDVAVAPAGFEAHSLEVWVREFTHLPQLVHEVGES